MTDRAALFVRFNVPMDTRSVEGVTVEVEPAVSGRLQWIDPYRLLFEPTASLDDAHTYRISWKGEVSSATGAPLPLALDWSVETERPTVELTVEQSYWSEEETEHWKTPVEIQVWPGTTATDLRRAITVRARPRNDPDEPPTTAKFRLIRRDRKSSMSWLLVPQTHWPTDSRIEVEVSQDLVSVAGPLPVGQPTIASFDTSPGVAVSLECEEDFSDGCGPNGVTLGFDRPIRRDQFRHVTVSPRPPRFSIDTWYDSEGLTREAWIRGEFEIGRPYTISVSPRLRDAHGQTQVEPFRRTMTFVPPGPSLDLVPGQGIIPHEAGQAPTVGLEARYLEDATVEALSLDDLGLARILATGRDYWSFPAASKPRNIRLDPLPREGDHAWTSLAIDLQPLMGEPLGAVLLRAQPGALVPAAAGRPQPASSLALVQVTDLAAVVGLSPSKSMVRVSSLTTGAPVEGARVDLYPPAGHRRGGEVDHYGPSGPDGIVWLPDAAHIPVSTVAIIHKGDDRFGLTLGARGRDLGRENVVGEVVTDRRLYQPGDVVRVMGWAAMSTAKTDSGLRALERGVAKIHLEDARGRKLAERYVRIEEFGKFWAQLPIPTEASLGQFDAKVAIGSLQLSSSFKVREFEMPTFEVKAVADRGDLTHGESVRIDANASYLYGRETPIEVARRAVRCARNYFKPPGFADWQSATAAHVSYWTKEARSDLELEATAAHGHVSTDVSTSELPTGIAHRCVVDIAIQDAAYEEAGASASYWVHPSYYLMLGPIADALEPGDDTFVEVRAVDRAGDPTTGNPAEVEIVRVEERDHQVVRNRIKRCRVDLGTAAAKKRCAFRVPTDGRYEVSLTGTVDGAEVETNRSIYVWKRHRYAGRSEPAPEHPRLQVIADDELQPGQQLEVRIDGRQPAASGFVVGGHGGIRWVRNFELRDHLASLKVPVEDAWIPAMHLQTYVTEGSSTAGFPRLEAVGDSVRVPAETRRLEVQVTAPEVAGPGDPVELGLSVADSTGAPVDAHLTVWAVDEAVLTLQPLSLPDLVPRFAVDRGQEIEFLDEFSLLQRAYVPRSDPFGFYGFGTGFGRGSGAGFGGRGHRTPSVRHASAKVREDFDPAPIFIGDVSTGEDGRATVRADLPDSLTAFRVLAIASAGLPGGGPVGRFGQGETRLRVSSELTVSPLVPRVLRPGDRARVGALVANLSGSDGAVETRLEILDGTGIVRLQGLSLSEHRLTQGGQGVIPFEVTALAPGTARVRITSVMQGSDGTTRTDAVEVPLRVELERTLLRRSAVYGSVEDDARIAVQLEPPTRIAPGSGQVEIEVQASLLGGYLDAAEDLVEYPYGCVEQTSSRLVPLIALADLDATEPLGIDNAREFVAAGIARLESMQTHDGGFGYWPGAGRPHFYASAYATWILTLADTAGLDVSEDMLTRARQFLARHFDRDALPLPSGDTYADLRAAMALHALAEGGLAQPAALDELFARRDRLPVFGRALLLLAFPAEGRDEQRAALLEDIASEIDDRGPYARTKAPSIRYAEVFDSPVRTDAMVLLALARTAPDHPLLEKMARGLSRSRDAGQLRNTQENAYALLAMAAYARIAEATSPDTRARAWVGAEQVLDAHLEGRRANEIEAQASLPTTVAGAPSRVTLATEGDGRIYYRVGMQWAPAEPPTKAHAAGLIVETGLRTAFGTVAPGGSVTAGTLLALDLDVTADVRRGYVAVEVPLPAGLEAVDMTLGKGRSAMALSGHRGGWVTHEELRSDRVLLFADDLPPGRHRHTIFLRATTPGSYRMPPAHAESMYYPEISGHTAATTLTVR